MRLCIVAAVGRLAIHAEAASDTITVLPDGLGDFPTTEAVQGSWSIAGWRTRTPAGDTYPPEASDRVLDREHRTGDSVPNSSKCSARPSPISLLLPRDLL
jgi:hypothetical protein